MSDSVTIVSSTPLGEGAVLLELDGPLPEVTCMARQLAVQAHLNMKGVYEALPAYRTVLVRFDPHGYSVAEVHGALANLLPSLEGLPEAATRLVTLPVCYGGEHGPDLQDVARHTGLTAEQVIDYHAAVRYRVEFLGFSPGFPYLSGLPSQLATPRLSTPRVRVPAGSVGIAGTQTGFYPLASPGGWRIIGRIPAFQIDIAQPESFPYAAGDSIQFVPIEARRYEELVQAAPAIASEIQVRMPPQGRGLRVLRAGPASTVQDLGRVGWGAWGYATAGVLDREAAQIANRLVGNTPDCAVIELTLDGGSFQAVGDLLVAIAGADLSPELDGAPAMQQRAFWLRDSMRLSFGQRRSGLRAYMAVDGGIATPLLLGSRATDLLAGFGGFHGRALRAGDLIPAGEAEVASAGFSLAREQITDAIITPLRIVWGPQRAWFSQAEQEALLSSEFRVSSRSDRTGIRLTGRAIRQARECELLSEGNAPGAIQVPPSGEPIVLLMDARGIGGYPKIATVIGPDLGRLTQVLPGGPLRFQAVSIDAAREIAEATRQRLSDLPFATAPETTVRCAVEGVAGTPETGQCPRSLACLVSRRCVVDRITEPQNGADDIEGRVAGRNGAGCGFGVSKHGRRNRAK